MNEYTIEAATNSDLGRLNRVDVTVTANNEAEAIEKARQVVQRDVYTVKAIRVLSEPQVGIDTRPRIKKG